MHKKMVNYFCYVARILLHYFALIKLPEVQSLTVATSGFTSPYSFVLELRSLDPHAGGSRLTIW